MRELARILWRGLNGEADSSATGEEAGKWAAGADPCQLSRAHAHLVAAECALSRELRRKIEEDRQ